MTIRVYHRKESSFMDDGAPSYPRSAFVLAATVDTDALDRAYELTNNLDGYWAENAGVTAETPHTPRWRSTSCGDVLEDAAGKFHVVASFGFREVTFTDEEPAYVPSMDWGDPVARLHLLERIGHTAYNEAIAEHQRRSVIETVNGHAIRPVDSGRWGRLYMVGDTGKAYRTIEEARTFAAQQPPAPTKH